MNVFSILDVKLRSDQWVIPFLIEKNYAILLVAELCKRGEETWQRIAVINRYSMEVMYSSRADSSGTFEGDLRPFFVADAVLTNNPFLREGDQVEVFFFNVRRYRQDLIQMQASRRSLISMDSQELYLMSTGNVPQRYAARDGDRIRIRLLRAEYGLPSSMKRDSTGADSTAKKVAGSKGHYADLVNIEDELYYTYREFGVSLSVVPVIAWGALAEAPIDAAEFNPVTKNPSVGSNLFFEYEGRISCKDILLNWILPGIHLSLLGVKEPNGTKFTVGLVTSLIPSLRQYFGIFFGWHDLKYQCFGLTFSPSINFRVLVGAE